MATFASKLINFNVQAAVFDIEGTITPIDFALDTLFPYAINNLELFLDDHAEEPAVKDVISAIKAQENIPSTAGSKAVVEKIIQLMKANSKFFFLKTLQGMIWKEGYERGQFQGQLFKDAHENLKKWHAANIPLYTYSSGTANAQKLLFTHSIFGNLSNLFRGQFDTTCGQKTETSSYRNIADKIGHDPQNILFFSDAEAELQAAQKAGWQTIRVWKEGDFPRNTNFPIVNTFNIVNLTLKG